jgi:hypothetical protein
VAMGNYNDLDRVSRNALDQLSHDIRQTRSLTAFTPTSLTFMDWDSNSLSFVYDPSAGTLTRSKLGVTTVLLKQCDFLSFDLSQRNPSNDFTFYPVPADRPDLAKLIDVSWRCSRKILGSKLNTESVQTAKIVRRN